MVNERISNCDRFEELLAKNELTDAEFDFCVDHQQACSLGIHTTEALERRHGLDRKSTRLNSSHLGISYAVFCLKKKKESTRSCAASSPSYDTGPDRGRDTRRR